MTMIVFEDYRGYDISDKIKAVKLTEKGVDELFVVLQEAGYQPTYRMLLDDPAVIVWGSEGHKRTAAAGDYLIRDTTDGYMAMSSATFEKNFAKDV